MNEQGISVIIPVYNGEATLSTCLDAIFSQEKIEKNNYEVIVVDDGSTDKTEKISKRYEIIYKKLPENQGRIVARTTGAGLARFDKLLFIDSRVIASKELLSTALHCKQKVCYAGDLGEEDSEQRDIDKLFFILRKRYYNPHYPQKETLLQLTTENFYNIPKGTTCLLITKNIFFRALPEDNSKSANDDTRMFYNIVFFQKEPVFRSKELRVTYLQRTLKEGFSKWLFERGIRFSDFYLSQKPHYCFLFTITVVVFFSLALLSVSNINYLPLFLLILLTIYFFLCFFLGSKKPERILLFTHLYKLIFLFGLGCFCGFFIILLKKTPK